MLTPVVTGAVQTRCPRVQKSAFEETVARCDQIKPTESVIVGAQVDMAPQPPLAQTIRSELLDGVNDAVVYAPVP